MRAPALLLAALGLLAMLPSAGAGDVGMEVFLHELGDGTLHLLPPEMNAETGDTLKLSIVNQGADAHDLLVCGDAPKLEATCERVLARTETIPGQGTASLSVLLEEPGTFEYYSSLGFDKRAGMRGTLHVTGEPLGKDAPAAPLLILPAAAAAALLLRRRTP